MITSLSLCDGDQNGEAGYCCEVLLKSGCQRFDLETFFCRTEWCFSTNYLLSAFLPHDRLHGQAILVGVATESKVAHPADIAV